MNGNDQSLAELREENSLLRREVRTAREASDITAQMVVEQFVRLEETLHRLEEKAAEEVRLKHLLTEQLHVTEQRANDLASERRRLADLQIASLNMMEDIGAARAAAESAARVKGDFLANMSHEIRTPMTAILGFSEILREKVTDPQSVDALDTIKRNGEYLSKLIDDILDLSKIEAGGLQIEQIAFSPWQIVVDVVSLMRVRAQAKGLQLGLECHGAIPKMIVSDPVRLRQILINLTGNAIKFTAVGQVQLIVHLLDVCSDVPKIQIEIIDSGIGMTKEQMDKLFKPFSQADMSTTRKYGGTGLGLSISKRLADMLGGDITVASAPGKGSTFTLTVNTGPLDRDDLVDHVTEVAGPAKSADNNAPAPQAMALEGRMLLAEDGPDNQRLISFILKKAGAQVTVVQNGQIALEKALAARDQQDPFAVILMDMQMPVLDGYGAARKLREAGYVGPIIALTAHAMRGDREKCINAGCDDYVAKPIDREQLVSIVAKYIRNRSRPLAVNGCS